MKINYNEALEEFVKHPFAPQGAYYKKYQLGHIEKEYTTTVSSFIYALKGSATVYLDDMKYSFGANRIIHCAPNQCFKAETHTGECAELFEVAYVNDSDFSPYMHSSYEFTVGTNSKLTFLFHDLSQLSRKVHKKIDGTALIQSKILTYSIIAEILTSGQNFNKEDRFGIAEDAKIYLEHHYMEQHTLEALGRRYGISGKYFAGIFKQYTGVSPIEYLIHYRLGIAQNLLKSTFYSIKEISESIGYEDALYFSRCFKNRYGFSPSEWRYQK